MTQDGKEIATTESGALAVPNSLEDIGDQFMPGMDETDFVPPVMTLVQGQSKAHTEDDIPMGQYYCAQSGETWETLDMVLLKVARTRVLFEPEQLAAPICQSEDRINPRPGGKFHGVHACEQCPARNDAPWLLSPEDRDARERDPGLCTPGYTFLAVEAKTGMPFIMRINGTSVSPWKTVMTTFRMRHKNVPFAASVEVGARSRTNAANQSFYVMTPSVNPPFEMEEVQSYFKLAQELQGVDLTAFEEEQAATEDWVGKLVKPPELKYTADGDAVCDLTVDVKGLGETWIQALGTLGEEMNLSSEGQQLEMRVRPPVDDMPATLVSYTTIRHERSTKASRAQLRDIMSLVGAKEMTAEQGKEKLEEAFPGLASTKDLTEEQADSFVSMLKGEKPFAPEAPAPADEGTEPEVAF